MVVHQASGEDVELPLEERHVSDAGSGVSGAPPVHAHRLGSATRIDCEVLGPPFATSPNSDEVIGHHHLTYVIAETKTGWLH
jgi:hypothetical protein